MRAIAIDGFGGPERLEVVDLPRPRPGNGEILIRAVAAGVNPADWKIREGWVRDVFPHRFPLVPGWDVAGVVEALGPGATRFGKGDKVWACAVKPVIQWGTYAELVSVPEEQAAVVPAKLLFEEAAAVPLCALAARQALETAGVGPDATVLVHAAAGGVGHFAVQLARLAGARVYGTCGAANREFVLGLGAEGVFDHSSEDFRSELLRRVREGVDVVLDLVGGSVLTASFDVVKRGGKLISTVQQPDHSLAAGRGIQVGLVMAQPRGDQLIELARLVDRGKLRTEIGKIYPLARAAEAHRHSQSGHLRGKLVLAL